MTTHRLDGQERKVLLFSQQKYRSVVHLLIIVGPVESAVYLEYKEQLYPFGPLSINSHLTVPLIIMQRSERKDCLFLIYLVIG
jgi:hypothetical protein